MKEVIERRRVSWADGSKAARLGLIKGVWQRGDSARDIAQAINRATGERLTRNAIIGVYHRSKDELKDYPLRHATPPGPKRIFGNARKARFPRPAPPRAPRPSPPVEVVASSIVEALPEITDTEVTAYDVSALLLDLDDLQPSQCKWAIREHDETHHHLFCGQPVEKHGAYCAHHAARARSQREEVPHEC